jgi:ornithine cyclodeaminase
MNVLLLNQSEIQRLLPMAECIRAMEDVFRALAGNRALLPLRQVLLLPGRRGAFAAMPGFLGSAEDGAAGAIGLKAITVFPGNHGTELDSHQGAVLLFEAECGRLLALMDASSITAIRTAAVSGLATRLLAREDAGDLALLGTGVQARSHLEAMLLVRPVRRVRVFGRDAGRMRRFVDEARARHGVAVEPTASAREAVLGAEIVCTVTSAVEPVLMGEWLSPGAHVNAVGASLPAARELDTTAVVRSRLFVDRRESALHEAGDFLIPKREGAIGDDHIVAELGELVGGAAPGRRSADEVTLFKSLGLALEDVASAQVAHRNALRTGLGTSVELGGARHPAG